MTDALFPSSLLAPLFSTADMRAVLDDRARLQRMLDVEAALARAEAAVGIVPAGAAGTIADACQARLFDLTALAEASVAAGNPAVALVEALTAEVARRNKTAADFVHWGANAQDVIDTAMVLELRTVIDTLFKDLDRATKAFTVLAGRHRRNMTVARTMMQHTLPMPFGLKVAGYAAALSRSRDRLRRLRKEALVLQFGGTAGTLAALGEKGLDVSERMAALLDIAHPDGPWHTHRDRFAEIASAFAILAGSCGKIARDFALLMQSEIAEIAEPTVGRSDTSSTRLKQRDPVGAAAALSAASVAPNLAATILNAQIQEQERAVGGWQTEWLTFPALALAVSGALRAVVDIAEGLTVDIERMKSNLEASGGLVFVEAVVFALADKIGGKSEAEKLVGRLARQAAQDKRTFKDTVTNSADVKLHLSATEIDRLFMPNHYQGSAQSFIDRLVASSHGRTIRRVSSVSHLTEPKMPTAKTDHLAAIRAATSAIKATAAAEPAPAAAEKPAPVVEKPSPVVAKAEPVAEKPTPVVAKAEPVAEKPALIVEKPAPVVEKPAPAAPALAAASLVTAPLVVEAPALPVIKTPVTVAPAIEPVVQAPAEPPVATVAVPVVSEPAVSETTPAPVSEATLAPAQAENGAEPHAPANPDDEPGALLEVFARIEAFAKAAENENNKTSVAEGERKPA